MKISASFPAVVGTVPEARRLASATLATWGCDELVGDVTLVLSELVGNAVLHVGEGSVDVELDFDRHRLRVRVSDTNPEMHERSDSKRGATTGRGLKIVEALTSRWGVERGDDHKVVWAEFDLSLSRSS